MSQALPLSGKDPLAALDLEFHACALEKFDRRAVVELGERLREKIGVGAHLLRKFLGRPGVGDVAAAFARDADLAARLLHLFDQQHAKPVARRGSRGHHARGARPDDDYVIRLFFFHLFHTGTKIGIYFFHSGKIFLSLPPSKPFQSF